MSTEQVAHPEGRTAVLAVCLLGVTTALLTMARDTSPVGPPDVLTPWSLAVGLAVLFTIAELCAIHIEVRGQALSVTLSGIPLVVGVMFLTPIDFVLARVVGGVLSFVVIRPRPIKMAFNITQYAAEAALTSVAVGVLLGADNRFDLRTAAAVYAVVAVVDQVLIGLVWRVIAWHQGRLGRRHLLESHLEGLVTSLLSTTFTFAVVLLVDRGAVGAITLAVLLTATAAAYRSFQVLHQRHRALEQVHDFVGLHDVGTRSSAAVAASMLEELRKLMGAEQAEMVIGSGAGTRRFVAAEDGPVHRRSPDLDAGLLGRICPDGGARLLSQTTRVAEERAWLQRLAVRDAVVVPLTGDVGGVLVTNRQGATGTFTAQDLALLQTLVGHLTVAVRNTDLLDRLTYDATHDALTGLSNRLVLQTLLEAPGPPEPTVIVLDLDRFKDVNDTLGHPVGDRLLVAIARRLVESLPATAMVARLGGDEFAAHIPGLASDAEAVSLAERLAHDLSVPVDLPEAMLSIGASLGIARPISGTPGADLLRHADAAMYAAKTRGQGVVLYSPELDRGRAERLSLQADLHLALARDELDVLFQPKLDLRTDLVESVEALVRWEHPRLGPLAPTVFIPLAEVNGLIGTLTRVVLAKSLRQVRAWQAEGLELSVAVNLSAVVVNDPGLPEMIADALRSAGVPPQRLILEITESSVMGDPELAVSVLERIAAVGVTVSLDDFGTGYSSLSYLQRLPVSEVKIDQSFITRLGAEADSGRLLVESVINLAHGLGHRVVAEGAETEDTIALLRDIGCDLVQGFGISRPERAELVATFVRSHPGRNARILHIAT